MENVQGLEQRVKQALPGDQDIAELVQLISQAGRLVE